MALRAGFSYKAGLMAYRTTKGLKEDLRARIYQKLLNLGPGYKDSFTTAEISQLTTEGVEQLEVYYSKYLPQFFYSMLGPITLFVFLAQYSLKVSLILLLAVPLIPLSIMAVMSFAKKLLDKYWSIYLSLGDSFLENIQGLTSLKVFDSDDYINDQMNKEAEEFRIITMKVLSMQLNSITVMDLVAYGGTALGIILTIGEFSRGRLSFGHSLAIIMLSSEFFLPMRLLGSFFHISMNGISASKKIFKLLNLEERPGSLELENPDRICLKKLGFSYGDRKVLRDIDLSVDRGEFISIVGESGSGKSTIAKLLMGYESSYEGSIDLDGRELRDIGSQSIMENITYISHGEHIFKASLRENLLLNRKGIDDLKLWEILDQVNLKEYFLGQDGLDTEIKERGSNLSGGQRQRLSIARGLLSSSQVYIFDEATSNIDRESEEDIMRVIYSLKGQATVILISHRLLNVVDSDSIYVLRKGNLVERGCHRSLMERKGYYEELFSQQMELESYGGVGLV